MKAQPLKVLLLFILLVCLNWFYVLWVKHQFATMINAWFVLIPVIGFFYFTFAFIASYGLFTQKKFGLDLAYGVILFGTISVAISYMLVFNQYPWIDLMIVPIFFINLCIVMYMGLNRRYFLSE